jgi:hypothetical protein
VSDEPKLYPNQVAKQPRRVKMFVAERGGAPYQRQVPKLHLNKKQRRAIRAERKKDTEKWIEPKEGSNGQE